MALNQKVENKSHKDNGSCGFPFKPTKKPPKKAALKKSGYCFIPLFICILVNRTYRSSGRVVYILEGSIPSQGFGRAARY